MYSILYTALMEKSVVSMYDDEMDMDWDREYDNDQLYAEYIRAEERAHNEALAEEEDFDDEPDVSELTEWHDFDPDC